MSRISRQGHTAMKEPGLRAGRLCFRGAIPHEALTRHRVRPPSPGVTIGAARRGRMPRAVRRGSGATVRDASAAARGPPAGCGANQGKGNPLRSAGRR